MKYTSIKNLRMNLQTHSGMNNPDVVQKTKEEIMQKFSDSLKEGDSEAFSQAFTEFAEGIQQSIINDARRITDDAMQSLNTNVLNARGVRQLTTDENIFYQKTIDAMKSSNPQQAINNLDVVMPETIINAVFEYLKTEHELLSVINFKNTSAITKMILNTHGNQLATWDKLTTAIVTELTSGFKQVDMTLSKLSAFIPVSNDMLDLGPVWLDRYVREILAEAIAFGLEEAIVNGDGKNKPIGMNRQVGEGVSVVDGVYPVKKLIKITDLSPLTYGKLLSTMTTFSKGKDDNGKEKIARRAVKEVIMIVNPTDYLLKIMPATTIRGADGLYRNNVLPYPTRIIQSLAVEEGKAVIGLAQRYFMGIGSEKSGKITYSDEYRFLEDERVYMTKLYGHGQALDNNAFAYVDISELKPANIEVKVVSKDGNDDTGE